MSPESLLNPRITYQLSKEGTLFPFKDSCIKVATETFLARSTDQNRRIVQMILYGNLIPHWYYRSDQWIYQPFLNISKGIIHYVGDPKNADSNLYGEGTYQLDEYNTSYLLKQRNQPKI